MSAKRHFLYLHDIDFPDGTDPRIAVWRHSLEKGNKIFIYIVDYTNLKVGDVIFCDFGKFCSYVRLVDFVRHEDGTVTDYIVEELGIDLDKTCTMVNTTRSVVDDYLYKSDNRKLCVIVCMKEKA